MAFYEIDAQKVETFNVHFKKFTDNLDIDNDLMSSFSHSDLKSVIFLLLDFIDLNEYMNLIKEERGKLHFFIKSFLDYNKIPKTILIDILMTMKKFHKLKKLNICKHQLNNFQDNRHISHVWKFLYSLCTEVDDDELKIINSSFFNNPDETKSLEETICKLFLRKKLQETLQNLSDAFRRIDRTDLVDELKKYHGASQLFNRVLSEVKTYHIRQPTVDYPCGLAVILNVENFENFKVGSSHELSIRRGSSIDRDELKKVWTSFGFKTEVFNDLKSSEIKKCFQNICDNNQDYDIFVACLLSHGQADIIYGSDGLEVQISDIVDMVANNCAAFCGKPKLFFVQACQEYERKESSSNCIVKMKGKNILPEKGPLRDVYEAFSTVPGHVSYRDPCSGSVFIAALVQELLSWGDKEDIDLIMKRVKEKVFHFKQTPITRSTLRQNVILKRMR